MCCKQFCVTRHPAADAEKARESRNIRRGKGKMRNRRYTTRKGPLVVYSEDSGIVRAFRNIPGVDVARVDRLNLLQVTSGISASLLLRGDACCPSLGISLQQQLQAAQALKLLTGMQLAPGGHLGRFIIWTRSAFDRLDEVFGEQPDTEGHLVYKDWHALCL